MGSKGAVFVTENMDLFAKAAEVKVKSTTGAGDSMVAAISYGLSQNMDDVSIFKLALACAAAKVSKEGVKAPEKNDIEEFFRKNKIRKAGGIKMDIKALFSPSRMSLNCRQKQRKQLLMNL